jgi:hypothetical protein
MPFSSSEAGTLRARARRVTTRTPGSRRPFQSPDLGRVHPGTLGERFLRQAALLASGAEVGAELGERVAVGHGIEGFDAGLINPRTYQSSTAAGMPASNSAGAVPSVRRPKCARSPRSAHRSNGRSARR